MKNKTKYLNTTARVLSNDTAESQGKEPRVIKVHFDMPNAPSETILRVDNRTYMSRSFVENDRIRVFSSLKSESGENTPLPAIIADESFPDIFRGEPELLDKFRNCDRSLQEVIIERNLGEHFPSSVVGSIRINDYARAKTFYSLSKSTFTPNQQAYIEQWLDSYRHADNAKKLEYVLGITTSGSEKNSTIPIEEMRAALNARFSGMERQKEEIIRHLASSKFANHTGTVICLVGPAGTGKTALIRALGEILHKPYAFLPCSGMTTSLDVLGERPVYSSASVGRLVDTFYKVGTTDCLILDAFRKADGAVLVLDVGQPDFIGGKINGVDSAPDSIHIQRRADRNVICGFEFLEGLAVLAEKDIHAGLPELLRCCYPRSFTEASHRHSP